MPCSDPAWIEPFARRLMREEPKSLLDVGIGFGLGGMLAREYLDVWGVRYYPHEWTARIDGIELFEPYLLPHQQYLYSTIYVGNALDILPTLDVYDLILCVDVIEHLAKPESEQLMGLIAEHGKGYLISTPNHFFAQTPLFGNDAEAHLCQWAGAELADRGRVNRRGCLWVVEK